MLQRPLVRQIVAENEADAQYEHGIRCMVDRWALHPSGTWVDAACMSLPKAMSCCLIVLFQSSLPPPLSLASHVTFHSSP